MNVGIYSYSTDDLNEEISKYQKMVFNKFDLDIKQEILTKSKFSFGQTYNYNDHPDCLMNIIKKSNEDFIIFFDVDCVPLKKNFYEIVLDQIKDGNTLAGAVGCSNHKSPTKKYVHPCFMAFSKKLYFDCNSPNLRESETGDVVQNFTDVCIDKNKSIIYWNVTDSINKLWNLPDTNQMFGHGTVYEELIYHQFEIRCESNHLSFINKCKEILRSY